MVARRTALSSLMLMDLRAVLGSWRAARRSAAPPPPPAAPTAGGGDRAGGGGESPVPELGVE